MHGRVKIDFNNRTNSENLSLSCSLYTTNYSDTNDYNAACCLSVTPQKSRTCNAYVFCCLMFGRTYYICCPGVVGRSVFAVQAWSNLWDLIWKPPSHYSMLWHLPGQDVTMEVFGPCSPAPGFTSVLARRTSCSHLTCRVKIEQHKTAILSTH